MFMEHTKTINFIKIMVQRDILISNQKTNTLFTQLKPPTTFFTYNRQADFELMHNFYQDTGSAMAKRCKQITSYR